MATSRGRRYDVVRGAAPAQIAATTTTTAPPSLIIAVPPAARAVAPAGYDAARFDARFYVAEYADAPDEGDDAAARRHWEEARARGDRRVANGDLDATWYLARYHLTGTAGTDPKAVAAHHLATLGACDECAPNAQVEAMRATRTAAVERTPVAPARVTYRVLVSPEVDWSRAIFWETARALRHAVARLGYACDLSLRMSAAPHVVHILLGLNVTPASLIGRLSTDTIVVQLEQLDVGGSPWATPAYYATLERFVVWDFQRLNVEAIRRNVAALRSAPARLRYVPLGYAPTLCSTAVLPGAASTGAGGTGVLFVGGVNARRRAVLDQVRGGGGAVVSHSGDLWGDRLTRTVRDAAVCLNVHFFGADGLLETVRLTHMVANGALVVSEDVVDARVMREWSPYVVFAPYAQLAATTLAELRRPAAQRMALAQQRRTAFMTRLPQWRLLPLAPANAAAAERIRADRRRLSGDASDVRAAS